MWLKLALKQLPTILFFSACSHSDRQQVDKLNSLSYAYHYRCVDSAEHYARQAAAAAANYGDGRAEALNNRAFCSIIRMDYDGAEVLLNQIPSLTDNQIELLVSYVQQMRLCQRRSRNKDFYDYRERAIKALKRVNEERRLLTNRQQRRLLYAETELSVVSSTYYYYVGLERQSVDALMEINGEEVKRDTAQFLNYLYNIGAGGILSDTSALSIHRQEMDYLLRCFQIARRHDYRYFVANALEGIAEHLITASDSHDDLPLSLVSPRDMPDGELSIDLASQALSIFQDYGDVYQIAGAYRTLASCYRALGDNEAALYNLEQALADSAIQQAPDLVASIFEQLSVAYAAIDDKANSDNYRNSYLDLQEQTRQDRQLEARAGQLDYIVRQLNWILLAVAGSILLLIGTLWFFRYLRRHQCQDSSLDEEIEERQEQLVLAKRRLEEAQRRLLEQRAKISLVNNLLPLIDRMVYAIAHCPMDNGQSLTADGQWHKEYICELIGQINHDNAVLTHWIQLRQGQLFLHVESFPLQPLFMMVARSEKNFQMKGIHLKVEPTETVVKADRILTLFMLNTLADNARKFTPRDGQVDVYATETADYVEVSVKDSGVGMDEKQLARVFDRQVLVDDSTSASYTSLHLQQSHGFGLLNCKGIIEKYRKTSQLFSVCTLQAESQKGRGSRFFFRLPKGKAMALVLSLFAFGLPSVADSPLSRAAIYADSAYFSNINGTYERTLRFADSCRYFLNEHYLSIHPAGHDLLLEYDASGVTPSEIVWLHDSVPTNFNVILDIRNESAVAALALHQWQLYSYNNRIYTQLFKELSADATLADYCRTLQQTRENRIIALVLLVMVVLSLLLLYYINYLRPRLNARFSAERRRSDQLEMLADEQHRMEQELGALHVANAVLDNCLSTLKHETMYYPSRINQLVEQDDIETAGEVVSYYRELYNLLSLQAMSQVEAVKLHLQHLEHGILGDATLVDYLFELLRKQTKGKSPDVSYQRHDDKYIEAHVTMPGLPFRSFFTPSVDNIPLLLCRQIVRDHGEATNRRSCSIRAEQGGNNSTTFIIILPAYEKL